MPLDAGVDPRQLVERARRAVVVVCVISAVLWGLAGAVFIAPIVARPVGAGVAIAIAAVVMWRDRAVWSSEHVALWIEMHHPGLDFALVTAVDRSAVTESERPIVDTWLSRAVAGAAIDIRQSLGRAALRRIGPAFVAVVLSAVVMTLMSRLPVRAVLERGVALHRGGRLIDPLAQLRAVVIPPAYSHLPRQQITQPSEVSALVGSAVILQGRGRAAGMSATIGNAADLVRDADGGWEAQTTMPDSPTLVRLVAEDSSGAPPHDRLVTLIPVTDAPPSVQLLSPTRDSVMRQARGLLVLRAQAMDDIGLRAGHFEIVISAGDEDAGGVHARTIDIANHSLSDVRVAQLEASLRLDALGISPGSVLSIRALASDGNTVSGPGIGASDTRTFRIARPDEYDSVAVESAAPSVADSSALSERVVIQGTTRLVSRTTQQPPLAVDSLSRASRELADQQEAVRNAITAVMSADDENELPVADVLTAPERALLDSASYAMGEAAARLATRAPREALPSERRALAMLDSARSLARRLYLRSRPPRLLVDVDRVRLSGTDHPDPSDRTPGHRDTLATHWVMRLSQSAQSLASTRGRSQEAADTRRSLVDSLVVLRVEILSARPQVAEAVTHAIDAIHAGSDPLPALGHARALLTDPVSVDTRWQSGATTP